MAKTQAESSNSLSVFFLKKHGYLDKDCSYTSGGITWTYGYMGNKSNIGFSVVRNDFGTPQERAYVKLQYTYTYRYNGEKSDMDFKVDLTTTPCNLGGKRYWFICPLTKNGEYCGKRVGVIYGIDKWFGCRHCGNVAYQSQFQGGKFRVGAVCEPDVQKAYEQVTTKYYNGKETRKYKRYLRLRKKMNNSWARMFARFGNIF